MSDRCPQCDAEYGPDDAYCPTCGTPRRGDAARTTASGADAGATWPHQPTAATTRTDRDEGEDFVPLVIPPESRRSWQSSVGNRPLIVILIGLALVGLLGVGAWLAIGNDDDNGADALDGPDVPALVIGGSPAIATSAAVGVARDNTPAPAGTSTATLPVIAPGPDGSPTSAPSDSEAPSAAISPSTAPSPATSLVTPATPTASPPPTVTPPATATPSPTVAPTPARTAPSIPGSVFPNTAAGVLASIVADLEHPPTDSTPSAPVSLPTGDGTGGLLPQTPPA